MLDSYAAFMLPDVLGAATFDPPPEGASFDMSRVHRAWETADGHVVMMIIEDHQFQGLCRALGREDLMADPRFASLMDRVANLDVSSRSQRRSFGSGRPPSWWSGRGASGHHSRP
jgi:formyl-CoA transferase